MESGVEFAAGADFGEVLVKRMRCTRWEACRVVRRARRWFVEQGRRAAAPACSAGSAAARCGGRRRLRRAVLREEHPARAASRPARARDRARGRRRASPARSRSAGSRLRSRRARGARARSFKSARAVRRRASAARAASRSARRPSITAFVPSASPTRSTAAMPMAAALLRLMSSASCFHARLFRAGGEAALVGSQVALQVVDTRVALRRGRRPWPCARRRRGSRGCAGRWASR